MTIFPQAALAVAGMRIPAVANNQSTLRSYHGVSHTGLDVGGLRRAQACSADIRRLMPGWFAIPTLFLLACAGTGGQRGDVANVASREVRVPSMAGSGGVEPEAFEKRWFRYLGGGLACLSSGEGDASGEEMGYLPCLHIGPFAVGADLGEAGGSEEPFRTMKLADGRTAYAYSLPDFCIQGPQPWEPYVAVTVRGELINAVQVTGTSLRRKCGFSGLAPGDSVQRLATLLGPPAERHVDGETGRDVYSYYPFPFSFEVEGERIVSIRIWTPGE